MNVSAEDVLLICGNTHRTDFDIKNTERIINLMMRSAFFMASGMPIVNPSV